MENTYCVYKHTAPNGKVYIGQTMKSVKDRWKNGHGYYTQTHFGRAIKKYGWENFSHEILYDGLTKEEANYYEKYFISFYQSNKKECGYNSQSGGDRDYKYSETARENISNGLKRHYAKYGKPDSARARKALMRPVVQYDLLGNKIREWECGKFADDYYGGTNRNVCLACRGTHGVSTTYGYMWRYKSDGIEKLPPSKTIIYLIDENEEIKGIYNGTKEAAEKVGCSRNTVMNSLNGVYKDVRCAKGCRFVYAYEYEKEVANNA